jgi:hypothetical protein
LVSSQRRLAFDTLLAVLNDIARRTALGLDVG